MLGRPLGREDGILLGLLEGLVEGLLVGLDVGRVVGEFVGYPKQYMKSGSINTFIPKPHLDTDARTPYRTSQPLFGSTMEEQTSSCTNPSNSTLTCAK